MRAIRGAHQEYRSVGRKAQARSRPKTEPTDNNAHEPTAAVKPVRALPGSSVDAQVELLMYQFHTHVVAALEFKTHTWPALFTPAQLAWPGTIAAECQVV